MKSNARQQAGGRAAARNHVNKSITQDLARPVRQSAAQYKARKRAELAAVLEKFPVAHRNRLMTYDPVPPYSGPKVFELYNPLVAAQMASGVTLRGRPPVPFIVRRDETLIRPFGGFRIYWRDIEVGRALSYPSFDDCRRLRAERRASARGVERKLLDGES